MKFEYEAETPDHGPYYYLTPGPEAQSGDEMRWLTIISDIATNPEIIIRVVGAKRSNKSIPGMPANPVIKLKLVIERRDGTAPRATELLEIQRKLQLDPTQKTPRAQSAGRSATNLNPRMRVVQQGSEHIIVEE